MGRRKLVSAGTTERQAKPASTHSPITPSHNSLPQDSPLATSRAAEVGSPAPSISGSGYNSPTPSESSRKWDSTTPSFTDTASIPEPAHHLATGNQSVSPTKRRRGSAETSSSLNPNSTRTTHGQLRNDRLGALVNTLCTDFATSASWEAFANRFRGPSYLSPELDDIDHPAAALLRTWRDEGVPARCHTKAWT